MSKMDALRAMREANYAAGQARVAQAGGKRTPTQARRPVAPVAPATDAAPSAADEPATEALCGHRNMSGRTCTREHGHAAKSHRYS